MFVGGWWDGFRIAAATGSFVTILIIVLIVLLIVFIAKRV